MKRLLFAALFALVALPAHAQQARVVTACGSMAPFGPQTAGGVAFPTVDTTGKLCLSGGGGGTGISVPPSGTTSISGTCPSGNVLYNNAGNVGCQAAGGGGTIAAGTTPTSGFAAGQFMRSDGSLAQAANLISAPPIIQQRNGTTAQGLQVYNTYTDASNGIWGVFDWTTSANTLTIGAANNGTGVNSTVQFVGGGSIAFNYNTASAYMTIFTHVVPNGGGQYLGQSFQPWGVTYSDSFVSGNGSLPTITGSGGTCATGTKVGGSSAGTVVLSGICAAGNTIVFTGMRAIANGYACDAQDRTKPTALFVETASTTTGFTLTTGAVSSVAADVLQWKCMGY